LGDRHQNETLSVRGNQKTAYYQCSAKGGTWEKKGSRGETLSEGVHLQQTFKRLRKFRLGPPITREGGGWKPLTGGGELGAKSASRSAEIQPN